MVFELIESILAEGAATYFFNQNENLTNLLEESYGKVIVEQYASSLIKEEIELENLINKFQDDIECLLENKDEYENMKKIICEYEFNEEIGQPIDKTIGVFMCETIELAEGRKSLIEIFKNPSIFLDKYNKSAKKLNRIEIKEKIIKDIFKVWNDSYCTYA